MAKSGASLAERFEDEVRFLKTWATSPIKMGSVSPTGRALARLMVKQADPDPTGYTLEVGPGTGVVTQALVASGVSPKRVIAVEYDRDFCKLLRERFPGMTVIQGDALDLSNTLGEHRDVTFSSILSGLPLLNVPRAKRAPYLESLFDRLVPGGKIAQLSYSPIPPQDAIPGRFTVEGSKWVTFNLPPGRVWTYRRSA
jgi:phosphatidylethanolamine/phosphatidyl-N-methylethanolamine N-methyltransferase